jgi:sulfide:quinone oxidoreductase
MLRKCIRRHLHTKVAIIGGGDAGKSLESLLLSQRVFEPQDIRVFDPKSTYTYQSGLTLVGGGKKRLSEIRIKKKYLQSYVSDYIQDEVSLIIPEKNEIQTELNGSYFYDHLVLATGTNPTPSKTPGLLEALDDADCPVGSIYLPKYALKYSDLREYYLNRQSSENGNLKAVFTQPLSPIKCGGAPQKILHLSHETWTKQKLNVDYSFYSGSPKPFPADYYIPHLKAELEKKNVNLNLNSELIGVKGNERLAQFRNTETGDVFEVEFDILHATPLNLPPEFIKNSNLAASNGYADVNINSLQHNKFKNIWALGDSANLPTSKTNSAVNAQIWVLLQNFEDLKKGVSLDEIQGRYEGYSACPVLLGNNKVMLCEFGYEGKPRKSIPGFEHTKGNKFFYFLKNQVFHRLNMTNMNKHVDAILDT